MTLMANRDYCTVGDAMLIDPAWLDCAKLGLKTKPYNPLTAATGEVHLHHIENGQDKRVSGKMSVNDAMVTAKGLVYHSCTTYPGTSGTCAWSVSEPTKLAFFHIGGPEFHKEGADHRHPNLAIPGTVIAQLLQKWNGVEWMPNYVITDKQLQTKFESTMQLINVTPDLVEVVVNKLCEHSDYIIVNNIV